MKKNIKFWSLLFLLGSFAIFSGCSDDDDDSTGVTTDDAISRWSYEIDADNYLKVTFMN